MLTLRLRLKLRLKLRLRLLEFMLVLAGSILDMSAGAGDKYELREPLLALRKSVCEALGQPEQAAQTLHESAVAARQAGHLTHAMAAAHELSRLQGLQLGDTLSSGRLLVTHVLFNIVTGNALVTHQPS